MAHTADGEDGHHRPITGETMPNGLVLGMVAGAAGTAALNVVTYLDMVVRGRPSSEVPAQAAEALADKAGIDLAPAGQDDEEAQNRSSGLGALLGYVTGLGVGAVYGLARPRLAAVPLPVAAVAAGAAAMAGSDVPTAALGITDPRSWPASSWVVDIVAHLAYGLLTAVTYDAIAAGSRRPFRGAPA